MIPAPTIEEQLAYAKAKISRLEQQNELERQWFFGMLYNIGNCQKCRYFCICGPQYDCRKTMSRRLDKYIKQELAGGKK